jgi:hypothetical protein
MRVLELGRSSLAWSVCDRFHHQIVMLYCGSLILSQASGLKSGGPSLIRRFHRERSPQLLAEGQSLSVKSSVLRAPKRRRSQLLAKRSSWS